MTTIYSQKKSLDLEKVYQKIKPCILSQMKSYILQ